MRRIADDFSAGSMPFRSVLPAVCLLPEIKKQKFEKI
jgi:hypothetical protein